MNNDDMIRAMTNNEYVCVEEDIVRAGAVYAVSGQALPLDRWKLTNIVTGAQIELEADVLTLAPYPPNRRTRPDQRLVDEMTECINRYKRTQRPVQAFVETGRTVTDEEWHRLDAAAHLLAMYVIRNETLFRQAIMEGKDE